LVSVALQVFTLHDTAHDTFGGHLVGMNGSIVKAANAPRSFPHAEHLTS